ncbi:MAG: adenine deaminase, partial [Acidobacteriota bacterium]
MDLKSLIRHARGDEPADLLLRNGRVINVLSGEILPLDLAIAGDRVVGFGDYPATREVDLG